MVCYFLGINLAQAVHIMPDDYTRDLHFNTKSFPGLILYALERDLLQNTLLL
jgi:hypothetical protein